MEKLGGKHPGENSSESDPKSEVLSAEMVRRHIESDRGVEWVRMKDLLDKIEESCVDGRQEKGMVGTPGGNAGEFVLALAAVESTAGQEININEIDQVLEKYLESSGKFYMHTDRHALDHAGITPEQLFNPSDDKTKEDFLDKLTDPSNIGCGHLKLMLENPDQYGVRQELVREVIKSILKAFWNKNPNIIVDILEGDHKEGAVVNVLVDEKKITDDTKIPTISPNLDGEQMFVNDPQAIEYMRNKIANKMEEITGLEIDQNQYKSEVNRLGQRQLSATVGRLAGGLPVFNVFFKDGELDRVEQIS